MSNNENNHQPFPPVDESETELCKALWVSVALQAVVDARSNSNKAKMQYYKRQALIWLKAREGEDSEFATVCNLAGLDFDKTRRRLLRVVQSQHETADFRCIKKALLENRGLELRSKYLKRIRKQEKARESQRAKQAA